MKKLKNKQWLDRHAKTKHRKEIKRRYKYNQFVGTVSKRPLQSNKEKRKLHNRIQKNKFDALVAPENFSLYSNPKETLSFFSEIENKVRSSKPIFFDMHNIKVLSIDTIIYFLAIMKKLKHSEINFGIKGSIPSNEKCKYLLNSSGFFNYVHLSRIKIDLSYESDVVQISNGQNAEVSIAKKICDFVILKINLEKQDIRKLYNMIIELMTNTKQHAYKSKSYSITDWYVYVNYIQEKKAIRFIFLDTGAGIPTTVKRKRMETVRSVVYMGPKHTDYIKSALEGELRSSTGQPFRGKGLPQIYSFSKGGYIKNLTIISNRGYFTSGRNEDMEEDLEGTLFYWEISKDN